MTSDGVRKSWADPEVRQRRIEAIRKAWDDPLRLAAAGYANGLKRGRAANLKAYIAYHRRKAKCTKQQPH